MMTCCKSLAVPVPEGMVVAWIPACAGMTVLMLEEHNSVEGVCHVS